MAGDPENSAPRRGPSPLPVHIGLAIAEYAKAQQSSDIEPQELEQMMAGIRKYQDHPFRRNIKKLPVVWENEEVRIFYCAAKKPVASLLLVPSLINKSSILDLLPEKSFLRWLAGQGIDTYLLDWGRPVGDEMLHNIDTLVTEKLSPAIAQISAKARQKIHALGYCMGGTLLAAAALHNSENLRSIIFLASPWDFHAGDRRLADHVQLGTASALQMIEQNHCLPMDWIQSVFAAVNAERTLQKFSDFSMLDDDSEKAHLFVAVEDWLNDGIDMPSDLAKTCILDWYGDNKPGRGKWRVAGKVMDPAALSIPALIMASANDRLVPKDSSLAMASAMRAAKIMEPSSGHIGMMTGRRAEQQVWQPVAQRVKELS